MDLIIDSLEGQLNLPSSWISVYRLTGMKKILYIVNESN